MAILNRDDSVVILEDDGACARSSARRTANRSLNRRQPARAMKALPATSKSITHTRRKSTLMPRHRHHRLGWRAAIVLAAAWATLYPAATTLGASGQAGGAIQVFVTPSLTGPNGTYSLACLHRGTIVLNTSRLKKQIQRGSERARPDLACCSTGINDCDRSDHRRDRPLRRDQRKRPPQVHVRRTRRRVHHQRQ
jgi:hypothetical protein